MTESASEVADLELVRPARRLGVAAVAILFSLVALGAEAPRRVYIAPDDHTDYLWSADEETYRKAFLDTIDFYLDQADSTAADRSEHQGRWNCDGSFWMWTYERNKTPGEFARFLDRIRDGHMSVPLNALVSCYGGMPLEAVLRGMYYCGRVERRYGLRFTLAVAMENQTLPYGLGALWAGAGARYSWRGICGCASRLSPVRNTRRPHEIYWWQGLDGSRILLKWNSLLGSNKLIGGYAEAFDPAASLEFVETSPRFREVWPYRIVGIFGKGWDRVTTMDDEVVKLARKASNSERTVIVSNEEDFFQDFEHTYGDDLPRFSAAFGNEWDLYVASVSEMAARVRRAVEKLRTAEALATLVSSRRPELLGDRHEARDVAFMNLGLFWEHNWTADGPVARKTRAAWGRRLAEEIEEYVNDLEADAVAALGSMIPKQGSHPRFFAFNPLSWARTDILDIPWDGSPEVHVVDVERGKAVPSQLVRLDDGSTGRVRSYLRILGRDIPPVGYRVFEVRPGKPDAWAEAPSARGDLLENWRYRLRVADSGAITSLVDKSRGGRELARRIAERCINDLGGGQGTLSAENVGVVSATLRAEVQEPVARTTRITLYRELDRIDIANEIDQNFAQVLTWSFAFDLESPDVRHEEVGAILRARLTSDGGHYSPVHSRLDWLTLNHFASMSGADGSGVTLSNADLAFMKLGSSEVVDGVSRLDVATPQISVLAGGQVDGPRLGIPAQGGDSSFLQRFALRVHARFSSTQAMRFALEHQDPLRVGAVTGGRGYPAGKFSFLRLQGDDVLLWALKPAEEGIEAGIVARVWNVAPEPSDFSLSLTPGLKGVRRVTHLETDLGDIPLKKGALSEKLAPMQLSTYRLEAPWGVEPAGMLHGTPLQPPGPPSQELSS